MFITSSEATMLQTTLYSAIEATELLVKTIKPYTIQTARYTYLSVFYVSAFVFALGMIARDGYEWLKPRFMRWIDSVVESGYGNALEPTIEPNVEPNVEPTVEPTAPKIYKLRGQECIRTEELSTPIPASIKRYQLHKKEVILLQDWEAIAQITT